MVRSHGSLSEPQDKGAVIVRIRPTARDRQSAVRLADLTPAERRLVLALLAAESAAKTTAPP
jgi:hypothetical protein